MKKVVAVIGPTASGKTSLALKIAKALNGELVNADSRQIYKYMNIGTAKGNPQKIKDQNLEVKYDDSKKVLQIYQIDSIPIHLIDVVEPDETLSLAIYQQIAFQTLDYIFQKDKVPILVGGTGLYIDALTKGYRIPKVKPDKKLRKRLAKLEVNELQSLASELNSKKFNDLNNSDSNNPRRLIRFIEIEKSEKKPPIDQKSTPSFKTIFLRPKRTKNEIFARIQKRANALVEKGLLEETKILMEKAYDLSKPSMSAIAYPIAAKHLKGKISQQEMLSEIIQKEQNYAKRQITWFKRYDTKKISQNKELTELV
jgi:tRNA dimethylallyltransferase